MRKPKSKQKFTPVVLILILGTMAIPFSLLSYIFYFAWDSQIEGNPYKIAFEKDGKIYESNISGGGIAFDRGTNDDKLYLNSVNYLSDLIALSYGSYEIDKTNNPFFAGKIAIRNYQKFSQTEEKFLNAKNSVQISKFYDEKGNVIFSYEPEMSSEYVLKIRPTFPAFSKRKYGIGAMRDYINASKILEDKLGKKLKFRLDEANQLLILSF